MANEEHLTLIQQGVEIWNAWRRANPAVQPALNEANLSRANLSEADLTETHLHASITDGTLFVNVDLGLARQLLTVQHNGPSSLDTHTLIRSQGKIPEVFLRGCGVPESMIEYLPSLLGAMQPIQFYSCFISYSTRDDDFARRLHSREKKNVPGYPATTIGYPPAYHGCHWLPGYPMTTTGYPATSPGCHGKSPWPSVSTSAVR